MVSGWALRAGIALTQAQQSSCFSALPSFECARELQSCLQTFEVLFADLSYSLYPGSSPEGEPGSRGRAGIPSARRQQGRPAWQGAGAGPGHSSRRAWDGALPVGRPGGEVSLHREGLSSSDRKSGCRWVTGERKL